MRSTFFQNITHERVPGARAADVLLAYYSAAGGGFLLRSNRALSARCAVSGAEASRTYLHMKSEEGHRDGAASGISRRRFIERPGGRYRGSSPDGAWGVESFSAGSSASSGWITVFFRRALDWLSVLGTVPTALFSAKPLVGLKEEANGFARYAGAG